MARVRKMPQRMCVGCQEMRSKKELVRIVRTPTGEVLIDPTGKKSGRGAYVCPDAACLDLAVKKKQIERALNSPVSPEVIAHLREKIAAEQK